MDTQDSSRDDEIDLIDLIAVIWRYRYVVVFVTALSVAAGAAFAFLAAEPEPEPEEPDEPVAETESFTPEERFDARALLLFEPWVFERQEGEQIQRASRNYAPLATRIAEGIGLRAGEDRLEGEPLEEGVREAVAGATVARDDADEYLVVVGTTATSAQDSVEAAEVIVDRLQRRFEEIGLGEQNPVNTESGARPIFYVVEEPQIVETRTTEPPETDESEESEESEEPEERNAGVIVVVAGFAGLFFSVFLAFVLNYIRLVRQDPEAMRKLRGKT